MEAVELILAVYPDAAQAGRTLQRLRQMEKDGGMRLFNRAVISKDETGKAHISEGQDVNARGGALFGALVGVWLACWVDPLER